MYALNIFLIAIALELQPDNWLTMYYYGKVLGRQRKMKKSKDMFILAAEKLKLKFNYAIIILHTISNCYQ